MWEVKRWRSGFALRAFGDRSRDSDLKFVLLRGTFAMFRLSVHRAAVLAASFAGAAFASDGQPVAIRNDLAACVTIRPMPSRTDGNIVSAHADFELHRPISACGCFSALVTYASSVDIGGSRQTVQQGLMIIDESTAKMLVIATEPSLVAGRQVRLRFACSPPL